MRREGRLSGYIKGRRGYFAVRECNPELEDSAVLQISNSWPRVKVTNKPTNESKDSSRCRRIACRGCHCHPPSKALPKTKGKRNKLSKPALTFFSDPTLALPRHSQHQCLNGRVRIDHDCYSDNDSDVQDHDLAAYVNGHSLNDDDGASVVFHENDSCHHANDDSVDNGNHICGVYTHIHPDTAEGLEIHSKMLEISPISESDDENEWYQVVVSDIESKEDEWCLC